MRDTQVRAAAEDVTSPHGQVGRTLWFPLAAAGPRIPLTITGIRPIVPGSGASGRVGYRICVLDRDYLASEGVDTFGLGEPDGALGDYCTRTEPVVGTPLQARVFDERSHPSGPRRELVVGITPTRPGGVSRRW